MRLLYSQCIEHRDDVRTRKVLAIGIWRTGHVRWRITARSKRDTSMHARQISYLRLPRSMITRKFVHEENRHARAGLFEVKPDSVFSEDYRHPRLQHSPAQSLITNIACIQANCLLHQEVSCSTMERAKVACHANRGDC